MKRIADPDRQVAYLAYLNRENEFQHHGYDEEMKQYLMMQGGDPEAVEEKKVSPASSKQAQRNIELRKKRSEKAARRQSDKK